MAGETLPLPQASNCVRGLGNTRLRVTGGTRGTMRKLYWSLSVLAVGGLGALLFTDKGRQALRWVGENAGTAPDRLLEWNEAAQRELDRIQTALNRVAESLGAPPEAQSQAR